MSAEKFCLRWNDFEANISTAFRELREDKDFFDVTLACDDDQLQAHKVILSACSPFFRTVLKRNKHEHPLLYLKGVKYIDLVAVLNFMYHGEVNVAQEELNSFLAVAEELKVKGLTQNGSDKSTGRTDPISSSKQRPREPPERIDSISKRPRQSPQYPTPSHQSKPSFQQDDDDIQEVLPVKSEPVSIMPDPIPPSQPISAPVVEPSYSNPSISHSAGIVADPNMDNSMYGDEYGDYGTYEEGGDGSYEGSMMTGAATADGNKVIFDSLTDDMMMSIVDPEKGKIWACNQCGKQSKNKTNLQHHAEATHIPEQAIRYTCHLCGLTKGTYKAMVKHQYKDHRAAILKYNTSVKLNEIL